MEKTLNKSKVILILLETIGFAAGTVQGKAKLHNKFAAGGKRYIIGKGHNVIGYYVKMKTQSPHHNVVTVENIYCTKEQFNDLEVSKSYNVYYISNPYFKFGVLETYRRCME